MLFVVAALVACDDSGSGEATSTTGGSPPVRIEPDPTTPCDVAGEVLCTRDGNTLTCQDGSWTPVSCRSICRALEPPQCEIGCLITPMEDRCLCADLGAVCD
ncbi:MAG TPA: hypothetical protein VIK91_21495 [Nannocystis sp.]